MKVYIQVTLDHANADNLYYVGFPPRTRFQMVNKTEHLITLCPEGGIGTKTITRAQFDKDLYYIIGRQRMTDQQALEKAIEQVDSGAIGRPGDDRDRLIAVNKKVILALDMLEDLLISEGMSEQEAESAAIDELEKMLRDGPPKKKRSKSPKKKKKGLISL